MSSATAPQILLDKTIVLIVPAKGMDDEAGLRATLVNPGRTVRVLICVPKNDDPSVAAPADPLLAASVATSLAAIGTETQILLHAQAQSLGTGAFELHAPADMSSGDQIEFALALSDLVLKVDDSEPRLERAAHSLQRPVVRLGEPLPPLFQTRSITASLDPKEPGWLSDWRFIFGRFEQAILELFAFAWRGWNKDGLAESTKRLRTCVLPGWPVDPYFAPEEEWRGLVPDSAAVDQSSPIVARFEAMDRSALYGSYIHRDLIWVAYLLAAFAVLAAVAGTLTGSPWAKFWGYSELAALLLVLGLILASRHSALRDRWTACRLGAEQLRIARMSLPLLVLPSALATTSAADGHGGTEAEFRDRALEEVKRAVRDHGLPRRAGPLAPAKAAAWLHCIVADQIDYHHRNHRKLERFESWLNYFTALLFFVAFIAVVRHLWGSNHEPWLLLVTAAGPAFAAALHGAGTRLGIVHRAALSLEMEQTLRQIDSGLTKLKDDTHAFEDPEHEVRRLAFAAADAMGSENRSWHVLVRRYRDELP